MSTAATKPGSAGGQGRLPGLDGLRAFAVVWVMLLHAGYVVKYPEWLSSLANRGVHGVTLFFVLSGFLITWLLLEEEQTGGRVFSLRDFYVRRVFRILPPVVFFLTGLGLLSLVMELGIRPLDWAACVFFFRNLINGSYFTGHFWSLAIEEQFYLVWPVVMAWVPAGKRVWVTAGLCALAPIWRQVNMEVFGGQNLNWSRADLLYDALLTGALLAQLQRWPWFRSVLDGSAIRGWLAFLLGVGLIWGAIALALPRALLPARIPMELAGIALVIKVLVEGRAAGVQSCLGWGPVVWVGRLSYSLYLWQQVFFPKESAQPWQRVPWNIALAVAFAYASYRWIEQPALTWRRRFLSASTGNKSGSGGSNPYAKS